MAYLLAPRFTGQHLRLQLHDEDPGVGCLRVDAPVGADPGLNTAHSRPLLFRNQRIRGLTVSNYA